MEAYKAYIENIHDLETQLASLQEERAQLLNEVESIDMQIDLLWGIHESDKALVEATLANWPAGADSMDVYYRTIRVDTDGMIYHTVNEYTTVNIDEIDSFWSDFDEPYNVANAGWMAQRNETVQEISDIQQQMILIQQELAALNA